MTQETRHKTWLDHSSRITTATRCCNDSTTWAWSQQLQLWPVTSCLSITLKRAFTSQQLEGSIKRYMHKKVHIDSAAPSTLKP